MALLATLPDWLWRSLVIVVVLLVAIIVYRSMVIILRRMLARHDNGMTVLARLQRPGFWFVIGIALSLAQPALDLSARGVDAWNRAAGIAVPGLLGWMIVAILGAIADILKERADISVADNLRARRRRTRIDILRRIAVFVVVLATFCFMLMSIPSVRNIGVTLIASAGLAALAVGAAAQPALKNLIAGLQMAFTEPIRIDDVVIVDGEWGRIEEIRLTYVVVKIWDERRLVVPISKFLEESFQNWTRETSQILGSVFWHLDPATDVERLRAELVSLVEANERWDGRFCNLQVTDAKPEAIEVRALMTAKDASTAFDLRCDVREGLLRFIRAEMPEAIVRHRAYLEPASHR
ncbi:mechanosensitive ion channel family protein [Novosphingobium sp. JCM 18896]|uniref:mechanosensitive ion channel family protein n=1 Tax=Novosphingobium sp. JCM 18896 TaxID=2989731 RepID=UPI002222859D|nr:mechanosensitive ion channel family protein [Novosphingobium sp. JCM 18896]MCW1431651.1 mechanosensitive ion channel family protein [Novosphingobium sp. JCM 18896]